MIHRHTLGHVPRKPHTVLRDASGKLMLEACVTRNGFNGPYSCVYYRTPPTDEFVAEPFEVPGFRPAPLVDQRLLHRRHIKSQDAAPAGDFLTGRRTLLVSAHVHVGVIKPDRPASARFFSNGDGDELYFVKQGAGWVESLYGRLDFREHDYVWIPRSTPYRLHLVGDAATLLVFEGRPRISIPGDYRNSWGQLTDYAPYSHRDFRTPQELVEFDAGRHGSGPYEMVVKLADELTLHRYPQFPLDVVGWDGVLYPTALNIHDFQPKTGLVHLPPTIHTTFAGEGFVICSFVPRKTDFHPEAIPCPYAHANVEMDEILYYVAGNFTSRKGIDSESISLHPYGVTHGPHPGMYENSIGGSETSELAVMCDAYDRFRLTEAAAALEDQGYHESWVRG